VVDPVGQQLVEAVVEAPRLERLAEVACGLEQERDALVTPVLVDVRLTGCTVRT